MSSSDAPTDFNILMDVKGASEILNVPVSWLLNRARAGRIPHHRLGHYVRFSQEDLQQITAEARITPDNVGVHVR